LKSYFSGPTATANCDVVELVDAKRCIQSTFYVVTKDKFGNRKISGGDNLEVTVVESMLFPQHH
jgi:hypothetical protein